jgi:hypothetical protein
MVLAFNDCTIFHQAQKLGFAVLTRNVRDYDCLLQLCPKRESCSTNAAWCDLHLVAEEPPAQGLRPAAP